MGVQDEFEKFLAERGINETLALFVPEYAEYKEQKVSIPALLVHSPIDDYRLTHTGVCLLALECPQLCRCISPYTYEVATGNLSLLHYSIASIIRGSHKSYSLCPIALLNDMLAPLHSFGVILPDAVAAIFQGVLVFRELL